MFWEKFANKSSRTPYIERTIFFHCTSLSNHNCVPSNCPILLVQLNCVFIVFLQERLNKKEQNNLVSFCQNSGRVGLCRSVPTMESSHTPELLRVTSRGMSHTLPKYLSWQEQKIFKDLSPGTIASVSQL